MVNGDPAGAAVLANGRQDPRISEAFRHIAQEMPEKIRKSKRKLPAWAGNYRTAPAIMPTTPVALFPVPGSQPAALRLLLQHIRAVQTALQSPGEGSSGAGLRLSVNTWARVIWPFQRRNAVPRRPR